MGGRLCEPDQNVEKNYTIVTDDDKSKIKLEKLTQFLKNQKTELELNDLLVIAAEKNERIRRNLQGLQALQKA